MTKSSDAHENLQRWAATDYRLAGSGVERDCKKRAAFPLQVILFNYLFAIFLHVVGFSARTSDAVDGGIISDKDNHRAHSRSCSCQNAGVHRVRARDRRRPFAVAVWAGRGSTGERR